MKRLLDLDGLRLLSYVAIVSLWLVGQREAAAFVAVANLGWALRGIAEVLYRRSARR